MVNFQTIMDEITRTCILLQRQISDGEVQVIAEEWEESFRHLNDSQFIMAMKEHRRRSRYWPTEADILKAHEDLTPNSPALVALLPEAPPDWDRQQRNLQAMLDRLGRGMKVN